MTGAVSSWRCCAWCVCRCHAGDLQTAIEEPNAIAFRTELGLTVALPIFSMAALQTRANFQNSLPSRGLYSRIGNFENVAAFVTRIFKENLLPLGYKASPIL
jgi:hypothetical protein